ncbi:MAG TPA: response regulator transcription factor [Cerasibacillus sp.]|uniref:response regulator transcription factor n=1 Tax=Cerasibacillus sp. TaxID=2498711 RepID=UPI002F40D878
MNHIGIVSNNLNNIQRTARMLQKKVKNSSFFVHHPRQLQQNNLNRYDLLITSSTYIDDVLQQTDHSTKIAVCISEAAENQVERLLQINLDGYLTPNMKKQELIHAINMMLQGGVYVHPVFSTTLLQSYRTYVEIKIERPLHLLTKKEWVVLEHIANGSNNQVIAKKMGISSSTVKNHISSIFKKFGVNNRTDAVLKAVKNNWIII